MFLRKEKKWKESGKEALQGQFAVTVESRDEKSNPFSFESDRELLQAHVFYFSAPSCFFLLFS